MAFGRTAGAGARVLAIAIAVGGAAVGWCQPADPFLDALREGYRALEAREWSEAAASYRTALEVASGDERRFQATVGLAAALEGLGEGAAACELYGDALELRPDETRLRRQRVATCVAAGLPYDALAELELLVERDPRDIAALRDQIVLWGAVGRHARAAAAARALLELEPGDVEARVGLAVALYGLDRFDSAIEELRTVLADDPDHVRARYGLGVALLAAGQRDEAVEQYALLKEAAPDLAAALYAEIFE